MRNWKTTLLGAITGIGQIIAGFLTNNTVLIGTGVLSIVQGIVTKDAE